MDDIPRQQRIAELENRIQELNASSMEGHKGRARRNQIEAEIRAAVFSLKQLHGVEDEEKKK